MTEGKTKAPLELKYSHNIIEHLGLKLYQNKPTNVIAELISNAWDADAEKVWIDLNDSYIAVYDNGIGMTYEELANNYLVIGKKKRTNHNIDEVTAKSRKMMGRKGIGKLAPFGIASKVSLVTISSKNNKCCWIEIDLSSLLSESQQNTANYSIYKPEIIAEDITVEDLSKLLPKHDRHGCVKKFIDKLQNNQGTLLIMNDLSIKRNISPNTLTQSIGQRFTVTLLREDFTVYINDQEVTEKEALPEFTVRYPAHGYEEKTININNKDRLVKYWVGFIDKADWPQDQSGVGIYAHGKIAQDRPFVFGIKGREITTRYMYGVVEADWLDELGEEDIISTDRTSINWDNDDASEMYEWGAKLVAKWVNDYRKHQKEKNKDKIIDKIKSLPKELRVTDTERDAITNMVCNMSPKIYKDDQLQNEVIHNLTSAWLHEPARQVIKALWDTLKNTDIESNDFLVLIKKINNHLVPESLSLSVTVAQKIYALTKLYELSNIGTEDQLQPLLEEFPWILGTDKDIVTANKNLKNMAHQAAKAGIIPSHGKIKKDIKNHPDESLRPDFCFFSDAQEHTIYIVELKSPTIDLDYDHLSQLQSYMNWMRRSYSDARVEGILIGRNPTAITHSDNNIKITSWLDLCAQSRKDYIDLLMSMLYGIPEHLDDSRITKVLEFSGDAAQSLMLKFKDSNPRLQERFSDIDKSIGV